MGKKSSRATGVGGKKRFYRDGEGATGGGDRLDPDRLLPWGSESGGRGEESQKEEEKTGKFSRGNAEHLPRNGGDRSFVTLETRALLGGEAIVGKEKKKRRSGSC